LKKYEISAENLEKVAVVLAGGEKAVGFGWPEVADIYHRDEKRSKEGLVQLTRMTMQAALLDQWSQMNVVLSKAPFHVESIVEMMVYVLQRLGCLNGFWKVKGKDIAAEAIGEKRLVLCFEVIQQSVKPETEETIQREVLTLEYLLIIHRTFIIRLMNKAHNLNKKNIDKEERTMMKLMEYFEEWMQEKEAYKKPQQKKVNISSKLKVIRPCIKHKRGETNEPIEIDEPDSKKIATREPIEIDEPI
jgi:hypothetical protein